MHSIIHIYTNLFYLVDCFIFRALFGTTSEQVSYSVAEKIRVLNAVVEKGVDPKKLMLGCGHRYIFQFNLLLSFCYIYHCNFVLVQLKIQLT